MGIDFSANFSQMMRNHVLCTTGGWIVSNLTAVGRWQAIRMRISKKILRNGASELVLFCNAKNAYENEAYWVQWLLEMGPARLATF
jgi:hypothetical protein